MKSLDERTGYLMNQYIAGTCTVDEFNELLELLKIQQDDTLLEELLLKEVRKSRYHDAETMVDWEKMLSEIIQQKARQHRAPVRKMFTFRKMAAAAVLLLSLGGATYFWLQQNTADQNPKSAILENDIMPGRNGAILTMGNGEKLVLDSAQDGALAQQGNMHIVKNDNQIAYAPRAGQGSGEIVYNTLTTPRGRQFQLVLSDGTKVWLNAASSIRYPAAFAGNERHVEITGEVYFEVAHDKTKAFIVDITSPKGGTLPAGRQGREGAVEVLGTHFNINAYGDEPFIRTTLLEGKVKISSMVNGEWSILKPGEQARINLSTDQLINIITPDLDAVMAWKNGYFQFERADIQTVMRQISRWYDVDIQYEGAITKDKFGGNIPRDATLSQVLHALEQSLVHFKIEGKKVIVTP